VARKFVFKLQPVLDQRTRQEDARKRELGDLERQRLDVEARLRGLQSQIAQARADLRSRLNAGPDTHDAETPGRRVVGVSDVRLQASASLHLSQSAQRTAIELAGCYQRSEAARTRLLAAMTGRKAVQILRERRLEEFKLEQTRREAAQLDDIVSVRSARAQMSSPEGEA
jgi:flagellar export protein FliJ